MKHYSFYLKRFKKVASEWWSNSRDTSFIYRLIALFCGLFIYFMVLTFTLTLVFLFAIYCMSVGKLLKRRYKNNEDENTIIEGEWHHPYKLPSPPK